MKESRQGFWVGLFALVGLAALGVLIILFGQTTFWTSTKEAYVINVLLDNAAGVRSGTLVTIGGIEVGRVFDVAFADPQRFDQGVKVELLLEEGYRLHQGAEAYVTEPGLGQGRPPIRVHPGPPEAPLLPSGAEIRGVIAPAMQSLIPERIVTNLEMTSTRIREAAEVLKPVLQDLHRILEPREPRVVDQPGGPPGNLASAVTRFDSGLKHFNEVFGDPETKSRLREAIHNLHAMTEDGRTVMAELKGTSGDIRAAAADAKALIARTSTAVENIDGHVERVARAATADLELTSELLTRLNGITRSLEGGQGTLGRLLTDDRLYEALVLTFQRLAESAQEFRLLVEDWQKGKIRVGF